MFEQFWAIYPKKVAKKDAEKAFNRLKSDERLKAMAAIPRHVEYWNVTGTDKMFIPHAATWIRGARFDDELEMPQAVPKEQAWWTSEQGMIQKGRELGTEPRPGENWDQFKTRLTTTMRNRQ